MRQTWRNLTFLHWRYDPALVRRMIPLQFELDLYDGSAWIGLVPFVITDLTHPRAPAAPWLSSFPETNVRTYVTDGAGRRGVWFFSLDAARLAAVIGARIVFGLPYFWNRMSVVSDGPSVRYKSLRLHGPHASSEIAVQAGEAVPSPSQLELFLTARFRLYAVRRGRVIKADVEHAAWPLQRASVAGLVENLLRAAGFSDPVGEPLALFSREINVLVDSPRKI
jgi:uncharacterized protein YqjF (DUF2071 family)